MYDPRMPVVGTMLAESVLHTLDPFVFEISPGVGPRWYGLAYLSGFLVGWLILRWLANSGRIPMNARQVGDLVTNCILGVIIGGRLGHCVFYEPHLLVQFTGDFPFWGLLEIHKGGMASHGGVIGVAIAIILFARREKLPILAVGDPVAFVVPWGLMFGRLANWVNHELPGRLLPDEMQSNPPWWSVKYPHDLEAMATVPTQLEFLRDLAPATMRSPDPRFTEWLVATAYDSGHAMHAQVVEAITPVLPAYYPNNFAQALTEGPALLILMSVAWLAPRRAGTVAAVFLAGYGVLRYSTEQFREADSPVIAFGFLTLPMLLSITMVAAGGVFLFLSRKSEPIGGLVWKHPK
jgi:phosphatidylglycerol:prolipoprotein diacylglycerol transferase